MREVCTREDIKDRMVLCFATGKSQHRQVRHHSFILANTYCTYRLLTMKFTAFIATVSPVLAIPQYLSSREFVPQKWIAPAEGACKFP